MPIFALSNKNKEEMIMTNEAMKKKSNGAVQKNDSCLW